MSDTAPAVALPDVKFVQLVFNFDPDNGDLQSAGVSGFRPTFYADGTAGPNQALNETFSVEQVTLAYMNERSCAPEQAKTDTLALFSAMKTLLAQQVAGLLAPVADPAAGGGTV